MMTERHAEPGADVGSFLPRPGEPVGAYAERLRALHRDLTLVLEAVERGLAASGRSDEEHTEPEWDPSGAEPPPRPRRFQRRGGDETRLQPPAVEPPAEHAVVDVRPVLDDPAPGEHDLGPLRAPVPVRGSAARVVVMPSGTGALSRGFHQRESDRPDPRATEPVERTIPAPAAPPEPAALQSADPPAWPPPAPGARSAALSPVVLALAAAGWLTAIALILAVALGL